MSIQEVGKYRQFFDVDEKYFPCIDDSAIEAGAPWENTYPHETFIELLKNVETMLGGTTKRSVWIHGAYGTEMCIRDSNTDVHFTAEMVQEIKEQIKAYCSLRFTEEELEYLNRITWIKGSYIDFLRLWQPRYEDFKISDEAECGLSIETFGTWLNTSLYEIPTLAIVNEVYFRMAYDYDRLYASFRERLEQKIKDASGRYEIGSFSEFGLRRRLSAEAQELAVRKLKEAEFHGSEFVGTSNVYLAKKYNLTPVGTMAHEWIMCVGQGNHKHNPCLLYTSRCV